jgi:hypothetical protein
MTYLIISSLVLLSIFLYLIIELRASIHLIYIIPLTLFFIAGSYFYFDSVFGYPVLKTNEKKFRLISFMVNEEDDKIYFWIQQENENQPKAIFIAYDADTHRELEKVSDKLMEGQQIEGEFSELEEENEGEKAGLGTNKSKGGELVLHEMNVEHYLPEKNGN